MFSSYIFWCCDCGVVTGGDVEDIDCPSCGLTATRQHQFDNLHYTEAEKKRQLSTNGEQLA